jgi:hypothetical protein
MGLLSFWRGTASTLVHAPNNPTHTTPQRRGGSDRQTRIDSPETVLTACCIPSNSWISERALYVARPETMPVMPPPERAMPRDISSKKSILAILRLILELSRHRYLLATSVSATSIRFPIVLRTLKHTTSRQDIINLSSNFRQAGTSHININDASPPAPHAPCCPLVCDTIHHKGMLPYSPVQNSSLALASSRSY